jgi:hypothetical protein
VRADASKESQAAAAGRRGVAFSLWVLLLRNCVPSWLVGSNKNMTGVQYRYCCHGKKVGFCTGGERADCQQLLPPIPYSLHNIADGPHVLQGREDGRRDDTTTYLRYMYPPSRYGRSIHV